MVTVNATLGGVKIVCIGEAFSCDLVPQSNASWKEATPVELKSHQWNIKKIRIGAQGTGPTREDTSGLLYRFQRSASPVTNSSLIFRSRCMTCNMNAWNLDYATDTTVSAKGRPELTSQLQTWTFVVTWSLETSYPLFYLPVPLRSKWIPLGRFKKRTIHWL